MPETTTLDNLRRIMDEMALWILEEQRDVPLVPETVLADIGMDALETMELLMACEEEFGIELSDDDNEGVWTVGDIVRLIESKVKQAVAEPETRFCEKCGDGLGHGPGPLCCSCTWLADHPPVPPADEPARQGEDREIERPIHLLYNGEVLCGATASEPRNACTGCVAIARIALDKLLKPQPPAGAWRDLFAAEQRVRDLEADLAYEQASRKMLAADCAVVQDRNGRVQAENTAQRKRIQQLQAEVERASEREATLRRRLQALVGGDA